VTANCKQELGSTITPSLESTFSVMVVFFNCSMIEAGLHLSLLFLRVSVWSCLCRVCSVSKHAKHAMKFLQWRSHHASSTLHNIGRFLTVALSNCTCLSVWRPFPTPVVISTKTLVSDPNQISGDEPHIPGDVPRLLVSKLPTSGKAHKFQK
jgi:hypothetical protein